jgi:hypothetical protein
MSRIQDINRKLLDRAEDALVALINKLAEARKKIYRKLPEYWSEAIDYARQGEVTSSRAFR